MSGVIGQIENSIYQFYIDQFLKTKRGLSINCLWFVFIDKPSENGLAYIADSAKNMSENGDISQTTIYKEAIKYFTTGLAQSNTSIKDKPFFLANTVEVPGDETQAQSQTYEVMGGSGAITPKTVSAARDGTGVTTTQLYLNDFSFPNIIVRPWARAVSIYGLKFPCLRTVMRCVQYTRQFQDGPWQPTLTMTYNGVFPIGCPAYSLNYQQADSTKVLNVKWGYDCYKMSLGTIDYDSNSDHGWDYTVRDAAEQRNISWLDVSVGSDEMAQEGYEPDEKHTELKDIPEKDADASYVGGYGDMGEKQYVDRSPRKTEDERNEDAAHYTNYGEPESETHTQIINRPAEKDEDTSYFKDYGKIGNEKYQEKKTEQTLKDRNMDTAYADGYGKTNTKKVNEKGVEEGEKKRNNDATHSSTYGKEESDKRTLAVDTTELSLEWFQSLEDKFFNYVPFMHEAAVNADTAWFENYGAKNLGKKYCIFKNNVVKAIVAGNRFYNAKVTNTDDVAYADSYGGGAPKPYMITAEKSLIASMLPYFDTPFITKFFLGVGNVYTYLLTGNSANRDLDTVYTNNYGAGIPTYGLIQGTLNMFDTPYSTSLFLGYGNRYVMLGNVTADDHLDSTTFKYRALMREVPWYDHLDPTVFVYRALLKGVPRLDCLLDPWFEYRALIGRIPYYDHMPRGDFMTISLPRKTPINDVPTGNFISLSRTTPTQDVPTGNFSVLLRSVVVQDTPTGDMETLFGTVPYDDTPVGDVMRLHGTVPLNDTPDSNGPMISGAVPINDTAEGDSDNRLLKTTDIDDVPSDQSVMSLHKTVNDDDTPDGSGGVNMLEKGVDMKDVTNDGNNFTIRNVLLGNTPAHGSVGQSGNFNEVGKPTNDTPNGEKPNVVEPKSAVDDTAGISNKFYIPR